MCLKNIPYIRGSKLKGVEGAKTAAPFSVHTLYMTMFASYGKWAALLHRFRRPWTKPHLLAQIIF